MKTTLRMKLFTTTTALALLATTGWTMDLLARYPTTLTAEDTDPGHARAWECGSNDIFQVSQFTLKIGDSFKVETGAADLGIGHCTDGAVWAVLVPRDRGTLTSSVTKNGAAIGNVWLRFHPAQVSQLFPPDTVTENASDALAAKMNAVASRKMTTSWQANDKAMIPGPKDLTVFVDTKDGSHRFFVVDTAAKTAEYVDAFNQHSRNSVSPDQVPPVVIKTRPEAGSQDVSPGIREIKVTFNHAMTDESWSWSTAWENSSPDIVGKPRYESDHRTCVIKVKLEPDKTYGYWLNSDRFRNFTDTNGLPAVPYLLTFHTKKH
jgi:hypothetical protein